MKPPYFLVKPVITIPLLMASAFALYAPLDWAHSPYWPSSILNFMESVFPPIAGYARNSQFSEITRMYMVCTFLLLPLHFFYTYKQLAISNKEKWHKDLWNINSQWTLAKRLLLVLLVCVVVYFSLFVNPGYDFNLLPLNSSRAALGFGGWIVAGGAQGQLLAWVFCSVLSSIKFLKGE